MSERWRAYQEAGVDIEAGNAFVQRIKKLVAQTHTKGTVGDIGGFGGLYKPDLTDIRHPLLVAATDGVGTKLKLAFEFNVHQTVGIDLVAMSVNDVLVQGGKPLFFLDYFATGKLDLDVAETVVSGVVEGCKQAGCALLGGETAEMPDFYAPGEYDLSGFCVGLVDDDHLVDGNGIRRNDCLIGLASSGLHSNGFSLIRKLYARSGLSGEDVFPGTSRTVAQVLLEPTRIYAQSVGNLLRDLPIKGMVHVTGGGFYDNIARILPRSCSAKVDFGSWPMLPVFDWVKAEGDLAWEEMLQIFNCGIGYILIVQPDVADDVLSRLRGLDEPAWMIGAVVEAGAEPVLVDF